MKRFSVVLVAVLVSIFIFSLAGLGFAGEKTVKYNLTTQVTKMEWVLVPDVKGHVVGVYHRRGVAIYPNEVAAFSTRGTFDFIKKNGPLQGYSETTFKDGSTIVVKYKGTMTLATEEKLPSLKGTGKYIKGTGRFEGIKGKLSWAGSYITPYTKDKTKGDNYIEVTGTYTLPAKKKKK